MGGSDNNLKAPGETRNLAKHSFLIHHKDTKENTGPKVPCTKPII